MSDDELKSFPPDFLEAKLIERVRRGPSRWDMVLTIGAPGDPEDNPPYYGQAAARKSGLEH